MLCPSTLFRRNAQRESMKLPSYVGPQDSSALTLKRNVDGRAGPGYAQGNTIQLDDRIKCDEPFKGDGLTGEFAMTYWLSPVEVNVAEGGFADFKVCNESGEQVATFGFADEHEARIARALMIRAISKVVLVVAHRTVGRQTGDRDEQFPAL